MVWSFGRTLDYDRPLFNSGVAVKWWTGTIELIADALGRKFDEIRPVYEAVAHHEDIVVSFGTIKAGTTAGIRFAVEGIVGGKPFVVLEHISCMSLDVAPEWPAPVGLAGRAPPLQYRVIIEGSPGLVWNLDIEALDAWCGRRRISSNRFTPGARLVQAFSRNAICRNMSPEAAVDVTQMSCKSN